MAMLEGLRSDQEFESVIDRNVVVGEGTGRRVYAVRDCDDFVIKESKEPFHYSNIVEWIVWNAALKMGEDINGNECNKELAPLFARCIAISNSARFLMMERLGKLDTSDQVLLREWPSWLNDKKPSAFGKTADGKVKAIDYGMVNFYHALNPKNNG